MSVAAHHHKHGSLKTADNEPNKKLFMAAATWCGFCNKEKEVLKKEGITKDECEVVHCDEDKNHKACAGVGGFPTFVACDIGKDGNITECESEPVHIGFTPEIQDVLNKFNE